MPQKALFIIAPKDFQDHEYSAPKEILEEAGVGVITASQKTGSITGAFGSTAWATLNLSQIKVADYDAIVFIGGGGAVVYQQDSQAHKIAQEAVKQNKILAAICISPTTLAYAGVLKGKKATVWNADNQQYKILEKNGAFFANKPVVVDGKIITANGPPAAEEFGQKILQALKEN